MYSEKKGDQIKGRCELMPGVFEGSVEYAFYLLVNGKKTQVRWYESFPVHVFTLTPNEREQSVQVRGFVRSKADPDQKLSAVGVG